MCFFDLGLGVGPELDGRGWWVRVGGLGLSGVGQGYGWSELVWVRVRCAGFWCGSGFSVSQGWWCQVSGWSKVRLEWVRVSGCQSFGVSGFRGKSGFRGRSGFRGGSELGWIRVSGWVSVGVSQGFGVGQGWGVRGWMVRVLVWVRISGWVRVLRWIRLQGGSGLGVDQKLKTMLDLSKRWTTSCG